MDSGPNFLENRILALKGERRRSKKSASPTIIATKTRAGVVRRLDACVANLVSKLPVELLERVLDELPALEVLNANLVCRGWHDLIHSSLRLQFKIECFIAGIENNPNSLSISLLERTERVKQWKRAWKRLDWSEKQCTSSQIPHVGLWEDLDDFQVVGSYLGGFNPNGGNDFVFHRIGSETRNVSAQQRSVTGTLEPSMTCRDWAFSPEEDLIAVLRVHGDTAEADVVFYTMTTGDMHPEASSPTLPLNLDLPVPDGDSLASLLLCQDRVIILTEDHDSGRIELQVYDWKCGNMLASLHSNRRMETICLDHAAFLSRDVILLATTGTNQRERSDFLIAIELCNLSRTPCSLKDMLMHYPCVVLDFPEPLNGTGYDCITIYCDPLRARFRSDGLFESRSTAPLILLEVIFASNASDDEDEDAEDDDSTMVDFVISSEFILTILPELRSRPMGPWGNPIVSLPVWGSHMRILGSLLTSEVRVHGSRYLTARALPDDKFQLVLLDFDTGPALRLDEASGDAVVRQGDYRFWNEPRDAPSGPACREVVSSLVVNIRDSAFLLEDGIAIARYREDEAAGNQELEIYSI
ncbi:F-box protein [Phanerochaete sordida]|uniref:F-box protein n=1 Tax=Phanerochaete sordida TaxID=48140 RepID=A0A9P3GM44_9APHY|nr:F-box protein [Phanerochaete sordida]